MSVKPGNKLICLIYLVRWKTTSRSYALQIRNETKTEIDYCIFIDSLLIKVYFVNLNCNTIYAHLKLTVNKKLELKINTIVKGLRNLKLSCHLIGLLKT